MSREAFFFLPEGAPSTFTRDESLEKLPLPKLEDTLKRYYRNLLPYGSEDDLKNSRKLIEEFKNGVGKTLQKMLEEKASKERNWVNFTNALERLKILGSPELQNAPLIFKNKNSETFSEF
jgi:carnitine O-octanoyltransferase